MKKELKIKSRKIDELKWLEERKSGMWEWGKECYVKDGRRIKPKIRDYEK